MPSILYQIIDLLAATLRLIGLAVLGLGVGWLAIDLLHKTEEWQVQIAVFLGVLGLVIALTVFMAAGAMGIFCIGLGVAVFMWGMPKKKKEEDKK
jgi:hypothetical protein